jgi:hypothetical protein
MKTLRTLAIFALLLIPSANYAWKNRDVPGFGKLHDDALLFVSAKSLATGQGFRILSLPEQPAQTKYPVLYPLFLSVIWRLNPNFPSNLNLASALSWPLFVLALALAWIYWKGESLPRSRVLIVTAILAISPYLILFGCTLFSEVFFLCWLLGALLAARQPSLKMVAFAGLLAGCAYLSRTAGIALLVSMPASYLWKRDLRRAIAFAAGMLPFILGWGLWSATHKFHSSTPTLLYYTDYVKFQFLNVDLHNFLIVLWKDTDALLYSIGSLVLPQVIALEPVKILTQVIAVAMISGTIRLARNGIAIPYALFALVSSLMLIVWHFPPTERFVLPIFPLLAAGLVTELEHLIDMLRAAFRHKDASQRAVAGVFALIVFAIFGSALALQLFMTFKAMPGQAAEDRAHLADTKQTYSWIAQNLPPEAGILSNDDPLLYLYTGHRGNSAPLLPRWWYAGDHASLVGFFANIVPYCRDRGFEYLLSTSSDMSRWTGEEDAQAVQRVIQKNPQLEAIHTGSDGATIYRIR